MLLMRSQLDMKINNKVIVNDLERKTIYILDVQLTTSSKTKVVIISENIRLKLNKLRCEQMKNRQENAIRYIQLVVSIYPPNS